MDEELYKALKVYAATWGKPISEIIEEAVSQYIRRGNERSLKKPLGL